MKEYEKKYNIKGREIGLMGLNIILECLRLKCKGCKRFRRFLLNSGDIPLVEYCYWLDKTKVDDELYGTRLDVEKGMYIGYNACGRMMMKVRQELKNGLI